MTTSPSGLTGGVAVTYNGSATPPTNAGSYTVVATLTDPNYQGSATGTLVITKADQTITLTGVPQPSAMYGQSFTVSATGGAPPGGLLPSPILRRESSPRGAVLCRSTPCAAHPGVAAGGCRCGARFRAGGAKVLLNFLSACSTSRRFFCHRGSLYCNCSKTPGHEGG